MLIETILEAQRDAAMRARAELQPIVNELDDELRTEIQLVATELVTNAVKHGSVAAGEPILFRAQLREDAVRIEVSDRGPGPQLLAPDDPGETAQGGRGLMIVDRIAQRWGITRCGRRAFVWAEICAG